jgi:hypothetical protein
MNVFRTTWLATAVFVIVSTVVWWRLIDWSIAWEQLIPTLLLTPLIWWFVVGRRAQPQLVRGVVGGGLAGFVTQSARNIPRIASLYAHRGTGNGEDQAIAVASVAIYLFVAVGATLIGALLGFAVVLIQRRLDGAVHIS